MNLKRFIKLFLPPIISTFLKKIVYSRYGLHGDYSSWEEAKRRSSGYDDVNILKKVKESLLKVKNGEAVYERDGVIFDEIQYSWPLLAGLLLASSINKGNLSVLDFGGSLGTTYFQNRKFLSLLPNLSWNIIEQPHFVKEGRNYFQDEKLHFYEDIETCIMKEQPTVLVLSGVLQCIEKPYELLENLLSYNFSIVIIDRTPFHNKGYDRITIQKVPPSIYRASYPSYIFDKQKFLSFFNMKGYSLIEEFDAIDGKYDSINWKGFIFIGGNVK
jgi:putative methyltransferase (TIGR04325 family)